MNGETEKYAQRKIRILSEDDYFPDFDNCDEEVKSSLLPEISEDASKNIYWGKTSSKSLESDQK